MELLKFEDTCVISRHGSSPTPPDPEPEIQSDAVTDEVSAEDEEGDEDEDWDEEELEVIYEGPCMYQEEWTGFDYPVIEHSSVVFLPSNDVLIEVNDEISITTRKDRTRTAYAKSVKDVKLPLYGGEYTRITLKQTV